MLESVSHEIYYIKEDDVVHESLEDSCHNTSLEQFSLNPDAQVFTPLDARITPESTNAYITDNFVLGLVDCVCPLPVVDKSTPTIYDGYCKKPNLGVDLITISGVELPLLNTTPYGNDITTPEISILSETGLESGSNSSTKSGISNSNVCECLLNNDSIGDCSEDEHSGSLLATTGCLDLDTTPSVNLSIVTNGGELSLQNKTPNCNNVTTPNANTIKETESMSIIPQPENNTDGGRPLTQISTQNKLYTYTTLPSSFRLLPINDPHFMISTRCGGFEYFH